MIYYLIRINLPTKLSVNGTGFSIPLQSNTYKMQSRYCTAQLPLSSCSIHIWLQITRFAYLQSTSLIEQFHARAKECCGG